MLGDVERVKAALSAGAQPQEVYGRDSVTKRTLEPDLIAHGPNDYVLIVVRFGRVTMLGRICDEHRAQRSRSRSPCGQKKEKQVPPESKGADAGTPTYAPNP